MKSARVSNIWITIQMRKELATYCREAIVILLQEEQ
jgi:hypothetical protein